MIPIFELVDKLTGLYSKSMYINELDKLVETSGGFRHVEAYWALMRPDRALYEGELYIWGWEEV